MQYYINKVREFNQKYGYPTPETITAVTPEQSALRIRLIKEELKALREAIDMGFKRSEIIKELCDVIYVYAGAFVERGENTGDFLFVRPMLDVPSVYNALSEAINNIALCGIDYLESDALSKDVRDIVRSVCLRYNIDFDADGLKKAFDIVHASNMSKGTNGQPVFIDGKLQKGEDYMKADLSYLDKPDGDTVTIQKIRIESEGDPYGTMKTKQKEYEIKRVLKLYGSITVKAQNGETVKWVYNYATDEAQIESNMTQSEIKASNKAKRKQLMYRMEAIKPMKKKVS